MSRILILNGSIRKRNTYNLLKRLEPLLADHDVEFVNIMEYKLKPCVGCENCLRRGNCRIDDDADALLLKMSSADGIILGSPVYLRNIAGYVKILIDRGCAWYHRSPLAGKPIYFVTSTQASGSKTAVAFFRDLSLQWGTISCGNISRTMFNTDKPIPDRALRKFLYFLNPSNKRRFRPGFRHIIEFNTQKLLAAHVLPLDREFWEEKGYLNSDYYYSCRINPFYRLAGRIYFNLASFFMARAQKGTEPDD